MTRDESPDPVERYRSVLHLMARAQMHPVLLRRLDASDLVQQTLLEAYRDHRQFRGDSERERIAWLRRILTHNLANAVRDLRRGKRDVGQERSLAQVMEHSTAELSRWLAVDETSVCGRLERAEELLLLAEQFHQIPEANQQALALRYWRGCSLAEIGTEMGRSAAAVAGLLHRGLRQLRELMERKG